MSDVGTPEKVPPDIAESGVIYGIATSARSETARFLGVLESKDTFLNAQTCFDSVDKEGEHDV